ncbi:MAG: Do family serine endopeptidase [Alphaproteobacteria bacterium]|nr:Do family serine endopeptidase [Alphaproteobacteria bacterium]
MINSGCKNILLTTLMVLLLCPVAAQAQNQSEAAIPSSQSAIKMSFSPLVKRLSPAVVNIYTKRVVTSRVSPFVNDPFFSQFFGGGFAIPQQRLESSLGSGVIISDDGMVITNAHVIRNASEITVALSDGREFPADVKVMDNASDIALLSIKAKEEKLPHATLQPSETLDVGDLVIAIGNPFGVGQTVTSGIVSALARSSLSINDINFFIQTDAAINPGNSGGPLVSMDGGVVGINSAIFSKDGGSLGIGFAIPSEMVASVLAAYKGGQITKDGEIKRPWIGITAQDVTSDIAASLGLARPVGALISSLHDESPARKAGLRSGDIVLAVNGHKIHDAAEMRFRMAMVALGQTSNLDIWNKDLPKDQVKTLSVQLIAPPEVPARDERLVSGHNPLSGATLMNLSPAVEIELGLKESPDHGVVVGKLAPNAIASRVVTIGDVITSINGQKIAKVEDALDAIRTPTAKGWVLKIISSGSGGQERTLIVR